MKRTLTFALGLGVFIAASAVNKSDLPTGLDEASVIGSAEFGLVAVENLTAEQRAVLQAKYRYWTSTTYVAPKAPI